jgi:predicted AAA+ superfamily ATPase
MYPFTIKELGLSSQGDFHNLLQLGGFPEPFLSGSEEEARRWSREYRHLFIDEEVKALESVQDIGKLELLMLRLPDLVGAPLSLNALREDLQINHRTVARWVDILERLYMIFLISPFGSPKIRAVKKERKHYHYNWNPIADQGYRFENLVAVHLKKWVDFQNDVRGTDYELRYFRDVNGKEVDFVVVDRKTPLFFIESKWGDERPSQTLFYLKERFPSAEAWQVSATGKEDFVTTSNVAVCPAVKFLQRFI